MKLWDRWKPLPNLCELVSGCVAEAIVAFERKKVGLEGACKGVLCGFAGDCPPGVAF